MKEILMQMLNEINAGLKTALTRVNELVAENKALKEALAKPGPLADASKVIERIDVDSRTIEVWPVQPKQEPVATMKMLHTYGDTTPPKRPWVGLTDEEASWCQAPSTIQTWKRIEAKLKEKNCV